ncbi:transposase [Levilactobacillus brevis]
MKQFFLNHYSLKNREQVTQVVMDLNAQYQTFIHYLFPNAKLIVDNFHLVQMTLRALNQTRVQLMKKYHPNTPEYRVLKSYWRLYLMNYEALEKSQPQWFSHLRNRLTQEQLIWSGLNLSHEFENTYFTAHKLVEAFRSRDYAAFTAQIPKKKRKLVELLECKDYIVPLNQDVIVKKTIYRSSARITNQQRDQVKRVLHKQGYQGRISSIRYTRVNYKYSFKVSVKYRGSVGKFLVNTKNETVEFKGMV